MFTAWRCEHNNKAARDKGISCTSTAVTTGTSSNSTLKYTKPHSHLPAPGRVGAYKYKVCNVVKGAASTDPSAKPHAIVAGSYSNSFKLMSDSILKVRNVAKGAASTDPSAKPHAIVAGSYSYLQADVRLNLPGKP